MSIITMMVDYGDRVYKYTPQGYTVEVEEGNRLLAGGPRVNTYGMEHFRLDLRCWEIEKKEESEDGQWETLYFRKRQREEFIVIKDYLTESSGAYTAYGYEEVNGKYYVFSDSVGTEVFDLNDWTVRKVSLSYPGYGKQAVIFAKKENS